VEPESGAVSLIGNIRKMGSGLEWRANQRKDKAVRHSRADPIFPIMMHRITLFAAITCLLIAACSGADKASINGVLDARNAAITAHDIGAYSSLILPDYTDHARSKVDVVAQMIHLFDRFDALEMHSFNREIHLVDDTHADCAQSYRLKVRADGRWREMVQREELSLQRTAAGWKISGGL